MSADILTFPGEGLPDRPITQDEIDKLFSKNFIDLEMRISDVENMGEIAQNLIAKCAAREDKPHDLQLATFAVFQLSKMLTKLKSDYYAAWHGELDLGQEP
jgi:hypothetical protein